MRRLSVMISTVWLVSMPVFAEMTGAEDTCYGEADVIVGSVVEELRSVSEDAKNMVDDGVGFMVRETDGAIEGAKAAFSQTAPYNDLRKDCAGVVESKWDTSNDILFRSYKVSSNVGEELTHGVGVEKGSSVDVSAAFSGIQFPEGTSAYFRPDFNKLFVRQTLDNLLLIEDVLAEQHHASRELLGHQVEIKTKFVETTQSTLNELGFSWDFEGKGDGAANVFGDLDFSAQDILTGGLRSAASVLDSDVSSGVIQVAKTTGSLTMSLYIQALEQSDDTEVLSAPRVVTRDGSTAIIQVGDEQMIPKELGTNNQNTNPYIEYDGWELELLGVQMEVTPELRDGGLIDLEIHPVIQEVVGYDDYTLAIPFTSSTATMDTESELTGSLPYLRLRELQTRVTIADGSTIGMGGLIYDKIESYSDKVPLLGSIPYIGRLFRSEGESVTKRNLMIFVTATEVDVSGRKASDLALKK